MGLNLALIIRALRFGPRDAWHRGSSAYRRINPLQPRDQQADSETIRASYLTLPKVPLEAVISSRPSIVIEGCYRYIGGGMPLEDMMPLLTILRDRNPGAVLEIGTFNGFTTRFMALNLPASTIHTLDLPEDFDLEAHDGPLPKDDFHLIEKRRVGESYRSDPLVRNVVQHHGDSANWDFSNAPGAEFFLIDGSHTYEYARSDTEKSIAAARGRRSTFVWHDCDLNHPGVVRWLAEMVKGRYPVSQLFGTNLALMDYQC